MHKFIIQEAVNNKLPGFCGGFISSIMLARSGFLKDLSRKQQTRLLQEMGYEPHPAFPLCRTTNPVLPDRGCPRLYVHHAAEVRGVTQAAEVARQYTLANHHGSAGDLTLSQITKRITKAIQNGQPGFCGGFISTTHVQQLIGEIDIQQIVLRMGYHRHPTIEDLLVKDGNPDESLEHYTTANTFVPPTW